MIHDEELTREFVVESLSHLSQVEAQILEIESAGADFDIELVNTVFRAIHSVKGAAGFLGFTSVNGLAHSLENVLNKVRTREIVLDKHHTDVLLRSSDQLRLLVEAIDSSNDVDVSSWVKELDELLEKKDGASENAVEVGLSTDQIEPVDDAGADAGSENAAETEHETRSESSPAVSTASKSKSNDSFVRVNVGVLDRLMNLAGELVLSRNQLLAAVARGTHDGLDVVTARVDQLTSELQETIMQTRMQPIGSIFSRFPRVVRDLCDKLRKECSLEIEGNEVEVDKTIVEAMGDPLTHLVRNCLDHGIESVEARLLAGKPRNGTVRLRAFHQAGKVCIRIEDDGAGMDPTKIKQKAIEKGMLTAEQASVMTDGEAYRLIFAPGFSTAATISDVSGRGVGMDVVKTNIEQLGGTVDIESDLGRGAAIHITLPLTLAIVPSMIVSCDGERFAVPQSNIAELVRVPASEMMNQIGIVHGAEVLRLRGKLLPLVRLDRSLGLVPANPVRESALATSSTNGEGSLDGSFDRPPKAACILVLETGQMRYGLLVDGIHDNEEIVVKPLGRHVRDLGVFAGATILGDGYVALILDVMGIAIKCGLRTVDSNVSAESSLAAQSSELHRLLIFENHPTEQFAIPMTMVSRIEQIQASSVQEVGGESLLISQGRSTPLMRLEHIIGACPHDSKNDRLYVIIFRLHQREIGLIARTLKDIRDVEMNIERSANSPAGVFGVVIVDEIATRVLDVMELAGGLQEMRVDMSSKWSSNSTHSEPQKTPTVLLAEDSDFFRAHVTRTLEGEGLHVIAAVDGVDAWQHLSNQFDEIDLIVTDIEMPRMDGLEFVRNVRSHQETADLPVIALTTLSSDDDRQRGKHAGVDEYQVKMDPVQLIEAVRRLMHSSKGSDRVSPGLSKAGAGV